MVFVFFGIGSGA